MSERFKYAKNGIFRIENFAEHLAADDFPRIYLGKLCDMKWYSKLRISENGNKVFPVIYCGNDNPKVEHSVQIYFKLKNHSDANKKDFNQTQKEVLKSDEVSMGFYTPILEILDLKNGWLDDGTLSFEYGIQVEAVMKHKIWRFNFDDKLFNAGAEMVQFWRLEYPKIVGPFYTHKKLLHFHFEKLATFGDHLTIVSEGETWREGFIGLLQLCHGVRLNLTKRKCGKILDAAYSRKMSNVVSYCDWYLVQENTWERLEGYEKDWILYANKFNLRHFLVSMTKSMTSLKEFVSEEDVEKMSNESMKMFVAKFLYEKF